MNIPASGIVCVLFFLGLLTERTGSPWWKLSVDAKPGSAFLLEPDIKYVSFLLGDCLTEKTGTPWFRVFLSPFPDCSVGLICSLDLLLRLILASKIEIPHLTFVLRLFNRVLINILSLKINYCLSLFTDSSVAFLIFMFIPGHIYEDFFKENLLKLIPLLIPMETSSVQLQ